MCAAALLASCRTPRARPKRTLTVAAAANLTDVFGEVGRAFKAKTGIEVIFSYGSTAQLATQIENGAPFDLFAAADTEHVDSLVAGPQTHQRQPRHLRAGSACFVDSRRRAERRSRTEGPGRTSRSASSPSPSRSWRPTVRQASKYSRVQVFGRAVQPKLVYGTSISMAKQYAASGSANAAFTAYSLVLHEKGTVLKIDSHLYKPIEQALGIVAASPHVEEAKQFRSFLLGAEGRTILANSGYLASLERKTAAF